ncbi:MAG: DNA replication and repair protein RecF [Niabella sp.]
MLQLRSISLLQFKNYTNRSFEFHKKITGICGNNGVGKTNILDAIHYLCFTKGYFSSSDAVNVQQGTKGFRIEGQFIKNDIPETAVCILRENTKKEFLVNDEAYDKFSQHIGRYPCVVIAPDDAILITGGSEERRTFLDALLSQLNAEYLQNLIQYNKVLQQRNSLLKSMAESGRADTELLHILNDQLIKPGNFIFEKRSHFLVSFLPKVKRLYADIAQKEEALTILYDSRLLETSFETLLIASENKDRLLQRTTTGIHRDDIVLQLNGQPFKNIASQGQRKSLLFALKLTELDVIFAEKKLMPLLLLDDVFEKLDEDRISNLLQKVCIENQGQVFITDTNKERLTSHLENLNARFDLISL